MPPLNCTPTNVKTCLWACVRGARKIFKTCPLLQVQTVTCCFKFLRKRSEIYQHVEIIWFTSCIKHTSLAGKVFSHLECFLFFHVGKPSIPRFSMLFQNYSWQEQDLFRYRAKNVFSLYDILRLLLHFSWFMLLYFLWLYVSCSIFLWL